MTGIKLSAAALLAASTTAIGFLWTQDAIAQSLVHRWSFNNDFLDSSGSGNHGTPFGSPTFVAGKFGQAASFASATLDGVHLDFFAANLPLEPTDHWTMNVWLNLTEPLGSLEHIAGFSLDDGYLGAADIGRGRSFISQTGVDNNDFYFWGANADRASGVDYSADGQWHMYTISYDGTNLNMYKDGLPVISAPPAPNAFQLAYDEVHVGNPSQWNNNFDGAVDEFAIFNGALSEGQIGGLFVNNDFTQQAFLNPTFSVNRDTGEIIFNNDSSFPIETLGYTIKSPSGSLKPADWETIAGRFDDAGDGSVDPNHNWTVLTNTSQTFSVELSEGVPGTDGGTIAIGKAISFGAVWAGNPVEDVSIEILLNDGLGTIKTLPAEFIGNNSNSFARGDLDADGDVDPADWALFRTAANASLAGATQTQAYLGGDFDGDYDKDIFDFSEFVKAYDAANGGGAFQAMLAVPEPSSICLLASTCVGATLIGRRKRCGGAIGLLAVVLTIQLTERTDAGLIALYQFNGNATETTGNNIDLHLVGDAAFVPSLHPGLGRALSLDGDGDGALGQDFVKIQTNDATVVAWVYATSLDGTFDSIVKQWGDVRGQFHFGLGGGSPAGTADLLQNEYGRTGSASTTLTAAAPDPFPTNEWVHVAFTLDSAAGVHRLYVNGDVVASADYPGPGLLGNKLTGANPRGLGIGLKPNTDGTAPSGVAGYWNGYIDEVGIYDHALTEADIKLIIANAQMGGQLDGTTVPEPGATALAILAAAFVTAKRCGRRIRPAAIAACLALYGVFVPISDSRAAVNAYYQFNGDANENTGVNINLNLVGDAGFIGSLHPGLGLALSLDGAGDGAIGENYSKIQTDNASAVAWVYATSVEGTWDSILKQWGDVRGQFHFGLGGGTPAGTADFLQNEYATAQNVSVNLTAASPFPVDQWVHVAFVLDAAAGQHRLYMNGEQIASTTYAGTLANKTTGATGLGVGVKPNTAGTAVSAGAPGYWDGYIDEVAIYDHALSETDIETIMANGLNGVQIDGTTNPYIRLEVNRNTGDVKLINDSPGGVGISAYQISSPTGRLQPPDLNNLAGNPGFPAGNGTGNGWEIDGANNATQLLETYLSGTSAFGTGLQISLGDVFAPGRAEDLTFHYRDSSGAIVNSLVTYVGAATVSADFDNDGDVDGADFLTWQRGFGLTGQTSKVNGDANGNGVVDGADLNVWKTSFGVSAVPAAAAVPEPSSVHLFIAAVSLLAACRTRDD